jgi:hypothetical protein
MSQAEFDRDHRRTLGLGRDRLVDAFRSDRNVTAVGVGHRFRGGQLTDEPVVIAAVAKKRPEAHVGRTQMLPRHVDVDGKRYGVDVIEAGPFSLDPTADVEPRVRNEADLGWHVPVPLDSRLRPAAQGSSLTNTEGFSLGTFGCLARDKTDGTLCIVSNNHILALYNGGHPGDLILQPGESDDDADAIARLKRFVPLSFNQNAPVTVDAAIAQVLDPALVSKNVALGLMPPISWAHPAIGLVVAGDHSGNTVICDMGDSLRQLNVELLTTDAVRPAEVGMIVDKVGRTTRYTSSYVIALDLTVAVWIHISLPDRLFFKNLHLVANLSWVGDSGSVVCAGGDGNRPVIGWNLGCFVLPLVPDMYDLPATATPEFADRIREFLALTPVGNLLIQVLYLNADTLVSRTEGVEASDDEKYYANDLYAKYRDFMEAALDDPDNPRFVVTQEHLDDTSLALYGFSLRATPEESEAAGQLYDRVLTRTLGMNYRQLLAFMSDISVYNEVYDILATIPGIVMRGPATL